MQWIATFLLRLLSAQLRHDRQSIDILINVLIAMHLDFSVKPG